MQVEQFNSGLFRKLELTAEQIASFAALWQQWLASRQRLQDRRIALACSLRAALPSLDSVSLDFITALDRTAAGARSPAASFQSELAPVDLSPRLGAHVWAHRMLGASPAAAAAAGALVQQLRQVLVEDGEAVRCFHVSGISRAHLSPLQSATISAESVGNGCTAFDGFRIAQLAASERRYTAAFASMPFGGRLAA